MLALKNVTTYAKYINISMAPMWLYGQGKMNRVFMPCSCVVMKDYLPSFRMNMQMLLKKPCVAMAVKYS